MKTTPFYWLALASISCFQSISAAPTPFDGSSISKQPADKDVLAKRFFAPGEIEGWVLQALHEDPDMQVADGYKGTEIEAYVEVLRKQVKEELEAEGSKIELV